MDKVKMKKSLYCILIILTSLFYCKNICAKEIPTYYMTTGDVKKIPVSFHGGDFYYHSTNLKVLQFSDTGKMEAVKCGNATVVLTYIDSSDKKTCKKFNVKVHDKVKGLKWKAKKKKIKIGNEYTFKISYKVKSKKNIDIIWSSTNPEIAYVDQTGKVTAISTGTTRIKCKVEGQKKAVISTKLKVVTVPVSMISVSDNDLAMKLNSQYNINETVSIFPEDATNKLLNTTSQDESIVKVMNGVLFAIGKGSTTVTIEATDGSGCKQVVNVTVGDWIERNDTHFFAHRGLSFEAPENTVKAFELAGEKGFYGIETDIWLSMDGQFVVSHDGNLQRMCGVDKPISELTYEEIRKIPIKTGSNYQYYKNDSTATTTPTLKEFLNICKKYNMIPMIEIKFAGGSAELDDSNAMFRVYKEINEIMGKDKVFVISFNQSAIMNLNEIIKKEQTDNISLCMLLGDYSDVSNIPAYQNCIDNNIGFSVEQYTNEAVIRRMISDGALVGLWTVDTPDNVKKYISWGISFITTDAILWKQ